MTDNMRLWDVLSKTDPKHTKGFKRAGGFVGTAIKPIWLTKRLTEQFGPAGTGWGMEKPEFQVVVAPAPDEILVFCTVALWYKTPEGPATVYGVGGDKVQGKNKYGPYANDEAFKASYTDALSNAMKQIGMGADIHMGLFEDEKYVREVAREYANEGKTPAIDAVDEADRGLVKDGETRSTYEVEKRAKAEKFTADTLGTWSLFRGGLELADWYNTPRSPKDKKTNRDWVENLKAAFPDLHARLKVVSDEIAMRGSNVQ